MKYGKKCIPIFIGDTVNIIEKLKFIRENGHLSVYDISKLIGVSVSSVNSYLNGTRKPSREIKNAIEWIYNAIYVYGDEICCKKKALIVINDYLRLRWNYDKLWL